MDTETKAPSCELGANQEPSNEIIHEPTLPGLSIPEEVRMALRNLADSQPKPISEDYELHRLHEVYKVSKRALKAEYETFKVAHVHENERISRLVTTDEEIADKKRADLATAQRIEAVEREVRALQQTTDLHPVFRKALTEAGYECDDLMSSSLLLSHGARLLPTSSALFFTGASGSGKTDAILKAAKFLPPEVVLSLTSLSEQALYYLCDIKHMYLIFGEISPRVDEQDDFRQMAIRQLISENKITRASVEKPNGNENVMVMKITEGPCVLTATTTKEANKFNDELQNRAYFVTSNDSVEMNERVLAAIANEAKNPIRPANDSLALMIEAFQKFHGSLLPLPVIIPFAEGIKPLDKTVTVRRLYKQILNNIKSNALIHQHSRERQTINGTTSIIATIDDYAVTYRVMTANAPRVLEICSRPAQKAFDEILKPALGKSGKALNTGEIQRILLKPNATVSRWLQDLTKSGLLICSTNRDGKQNLYLLNPDGEHFTQDLGLVSPGHLQENTKPTEEVYLSAFERLQEGISNVVAPFRKQI